MFPISYRRHRFPPPIIQHAVVRRWVLKFGPMIARRLRLCGPRPGDRWHLDEMVVRIAAKRLYLWRAVDQERRDPRCAAAASARPPRGRQTDAQAAAKARLCRLAAFVRRRIAAPWAQLSSSAGPAIKQSRREFTPGG